MKKLILLALMVILMAGCVKNEKNPIDYRGAVVTGNSKFLGVYQLQLQLTESQKQQNKYGQNYIWIYVTEFDYMMYHLGDTIK
ncbi:MAG: hypothetical protein K5920_09475 [Bacteroidales bacterium]|nr:hypothetical protein [Bacteroidales bacterium]